VVKKKDQKYYERFTFMKGSIGIGIYPMGMSISLLNLNSRISPLKKELCPKRNSDRGGEGR
jgi:hypothetical protein